MKKNLKFRDWTKEWFLPMPLVGAFLARYDDMMSKDQALVDVEALRERYRANQAARKAHMEEFAQALRLSTTGTVVARYEDVDRPQPALVLRVTAKNIWIVSSYASPGVRVMRTNLVIKNEFVTRDHRRLILGDEMRALLAEPALQLEAT